jgi:hypothetical protein
MDQPHAHITFARCLNNPVLPNLNWVWLFPIMHAIGQMAIVPRLSMGRW